MDSDLMGAGVLGEVRSGPDGQLYQWVEGVDGLGNPVGWWNPLKRLRKAARRLTSLAQRASGFIPGPYGAMARQALATANPWLKRAGLAGPQLGQLYEAPDGSLYQMAGLEDDPSVDGLGEDDPAAMMGIGRLGEVRTGPDGHLYQWTEAVDGLGNPIGGFWSRLRQAVRRGLPLVQRAAGFVPGWGTAVAAGLKTASPWLRRAGLAEDESVQGLAAEDLEGLSEEDLRGIAADEMAGMDQAPDSETVQGLGRYVSGEGPNVSPSQPAHFTPLW